MASSSYLHQLSASRGSLSSPTSLLFPRPSANYTSFSNPSASASSPSRPLFFPSYLRESDGSDDPTTPAPAPAPRAAPTEATRAWQLVRDHHWHRLLPYHHLASTFTRLAESEPEPHHLANYLAHDLIPRLYAHLHHANTKAKIWAGRYPTLAALMFCAGPGVVPGGWALVPHTAALFALPGHARSLLRNRGTNPAHTSSNRWLKFTDISLQAFYLPLALVHTPHILASLAQTAFVRLPASIWVGMGRGFQSFARAVGDSRELMVLGGRDRVWGRDAPSVLAGLALIGLGFGWEWISSRTQQGRRPGADDGSSAALSDSSDSFGSLGSSSQEAMYVSSDLGSDLNMIDSLTDSERVDVYAAAGFYQSSAPSDSSSMTIIPATTSNNNVAETPAGDMSTSEHSGSPDLAGIPSMRQEIFSMWIDELAMPPADGR
ncbi:unnamed protein product [Tilletia controversa]|nr:unnamed protein product [Tilletia controversa]